jgi:Flp pilus assembly protein TadG
MLMKRLAASRRGNVSVEFAIISTFFLLPLLLGAADFTCALTAQAQLNTALQALYYFAYTNPSSASNTTYAGYVVALINKASVYKITFPATLSSGAVNGSISYGCFTPPSTAITYQTTTCSASQTQQTLVNYQVTTTITLPFPLPGFTNPWPLSAAGKTQVQ